MSNYEYNKEYAKKWNKNNLKNIGISLRIKEYELLDEYCKKHNVSKSSLVKERLSDIINPK